MLSSKDLIANFLLLWIIINSIRCQNIEEMSKTLDEILVDTRSFRRPRDHEDVSSIWQEYEFGTGAGNREEVVVTNISMHKYINIPENINCQFLQAENAYLICAEDLMLLFYKINLDDLSIEQINVTTEGRILLFKILNLNTEETRHENNYVSDLVAVVHIKSEHGYSLYWYIISKNTYTLYLTMTVQNQIQDMEFIQEENQRKLLLLDNDDGYLEKQSLINVYAFNVNYTYHRIDIWYCRRFYVPKISNVQVCSIYGNTVLAFHGLNSVILYESRDEDISCKFEEFQVIRSNYLTNFVCFESGYIEYLAITGEESRLFHFFENEFQDNGETDLHINETAEIVWVTAIPLNTYRDESLLLVQLNDSNVIALAWQGSKFERVPLPNQIMNEFDLSKIVIIPKVGFVHGNVFVRIDVILKELAHPIHNDAESMLKTRILLEEVFRKQEAVFDETEARLNQSYLKDSPTVEFWNFSNVDVSNITIEKNVHYGAVKIGSVDLNMEDIATNVTSSLKKLEELEANLDQIISINYVSNLEDNSTEIILTPNVETIGDFITHDTLYTKTETPTFINNKSVSTTDNITNYSADDIIRGQKMFPSIDTDHLEVFSLNGVPLEEIVFDTSIKNYNDVDFSKLKRLEIDGHLTFSAINGENWENLMKNIIWKDKPANISGETIVEGQLIAEEASVENLNRLQYPQDYVLTNRIFPDPVNVTGEKYFSNLSVTNLVNISTINKISMDDFIVLSRHEVLDKEITFENLQIDGSLQLDGNTTGINISNNEDSLRETNNITSDVIFEKLIVIGKIIVQDSIDDKTWPDFDDLLLRTEKNAIITGTKTFLSNVTLNSNVTILSDRINGHLLTEFVTLDSAQQFLYLKKISANITFGNVSLGSLEKLEDYITREQNTSSGCLNKLLLFVKPPIIDNVSFDTLKQTISQTDFLEKVNETFKEVYFEDLTLSTLIADEILPNTINRIWNYTDLVTNMLTMFTLQNITGSLIVDNLETVVLDAEVINGIPINELNEWLTYARSRYEDIFSKNASIESLQTTGTLTVSSINDHDILDIYKEDTMGSVIFNEKVSIENLTVMGFVNGLNLSEFVADAIQKTEKNVTFTSCKTFENVTCEFLEVRYINEHFVDDILDPDREQTLKGPVTVNGSVTILKNFNATGKVGNLFFHEFTNRFTSLGNNSYALRGDFYFTENASVTKLDVDGPIQGLSFDSFLQTAISKNDSNVTISVKSFSGPIVFHGGFLIDSSLNNINLHRFHEKAVYIDKPFSINSKVVFKEDVHIQKNLLVKTKLQSSTIMGVDMKELQESAIARNKPEYFSGRMTFDNVTFRAGVTVKWINDLQMDLLIPLHTNQFITATALICKNVTFITYELFGYINYYTLEDIYTNTFMIYGNQNVTGNINIWGNVYAYHEFNAHFINGFSPKQIISLNTNDTLTGNFMFKDPVVLNKNLRILGPLNGINLINWEGTAIKTKSEAKQIIFGKWKVHGNVHFDRNIYFDEDVYFDGNINGSKLLSEINITQLSNALVKEYAQTNHLIDETNETLNNACQHLNALKCIAANQIYKYNTFDYFKIKEFEEDIHDIHTIEWDDVGYFLVNYGMCHMRLLMHTPSIGLEEMDEISDFGLIDQWFFFKSNRTIYLFTIAKHSCGRSLNNIWKLENDKLTHVLELGNITNVMNLYQEIFAGMIQKYPEMPPEDLQSDISKAAVSHEDEKINSILSNPIISIDQPLLHEQERFSKNPYVHLNNCIDCSSVLNFKVGIFEREEYIYYDKKVSEDYVYLCKHDTSQTKILQIIRAHRPKSFLILNFDGSVETLLIFVENDETIQIYEYRGIEGFVHRNTINMKVDKLYHFKLRKYTNLKKVHYLAAVHGKRLTILEAKMYGEKLDLETLHTDSCYMDTCSIR